MTTPPRAWFAGNRPVLAMAGATFALLIGWGTHQAISVITVATGKGGSPMALTFAVCFLFLWWIPLAWFERPRQITTRQAATLNAMTLTVHVPVYNEDAATLQAALNSLLCQTRLPNKVHVVDDGSTDPHAYDAVRPWFIDAATALGIEVRWVRTVNRGKRHAQMETLATDDADFYCTLDSDSTLDLTAIEEGLKPFADPQVMSVAGMIVVWNSQKNFLTRLTCTLYTPFTRGYRSAQSVMGKVMVNSGTLAFYRADVIRKYAASYPHESLFGKPMQMNDDSMTTFYAMLHGKTVHQPSSVAFTLVPEKYNHYFKQQLRWMRGTFVRSFWWFRYLPMRDFAWWMPLIELAQRPLIFVLVPLFYLSLPENVDYSRLFWTGLVVSLALNYLMCLRYFVIRRDDETLWQQLVIFALAPIAGAWRILVLRPLSTYAMLTFWKVSSWGTRAKVEVSA